MDTTNDWSSFSSDAIAPLLSRSFEGLGYLIWAKIDHICLQRNDLEQLYERASVSSSDPTERCVAEARQRIRETITALKQYRITHVCLGVSWCDWVCFAGGKTWISLYFKEFARHFVVLPRITYTPPCHTDGGTINAPPKRLASFAEFLQEEFFPTLGEWCGEHIELWNEFNLETDWVRIRDPGYSKFIIMIALAALVVRHHGKKVVLGGVTNSEELPQVFKLLAHGGLIPFLDVVGYHDLRGTWGDQIPSPHIGFHVDRITTACQTSFARDPHLLVRSAAHSMTSPALRHIFESEVKRLSSAAPAVWLTEYGFPVADPEGRFSPTYLERIQTTLFAYAATAVAQGTIERVYWYTHRDFVGESVRKHTTGWEDVLQYYYGDTDEKGTPRLLGQLLHEGGVRKVLEYAVRHDLFPLVDAASLKRQLPSDYKTQRAG